MSLIGSIGPATPMLSRAEPTPTTKSSEPETKGTQEPARSGGGEAAASRQSSQASGTGVAASARKGRPAEAAVAERQGPADQAQGNRALSSRDEAMRAKDAMSSAALVAQITDSLGGSGKTAGADRPSGAAGAKAYVVAQASPAELPAASRRADFSA